MRWLSVQHNTGAIWPGTQGTRRVRDSLFGVTVARSALPTADALQSRSRYAYGLPANSCPARPLRPSRKWPNRTYSKK